MATEFKCQSTHRYSCSAPHCVCPILEPDEDYQGAITGCGHLHKKTNMRRKVSPITVVAGLKQQVFDDYVQREISYEIYNHQMQRLNRIQKSLYHDE